MEVSAMRKWSEAQGEGADVFKDLNKSDPFIYLSESPHQSLIVGVMEDVRGLIYLQPLIVN